MMAETNFPEQAYTSIETVELNALRARISQLEAQRGGVVVVPELTESDLSSAIDMDSSRFGDAVNIPNTLESLNKILRNRVLADGMVGVDSDGLHDTFLALLKSNHEISADTPRIFLDWLDERAKDMDIYEDIRSAKGEVEG